MGLKESWEFPYLVRDILGAAEAKHKHHTERLAWWTGKQEEVESKLKTEGIVFDKSLAHPERAAASAKFSNTYQRQPSVQLDSQLLSDHDECTQKMYEHQGHVDRYTSWIAILSSAKQDQSYPLRVDDWHFFFGSMPTSGPDA